MNFSYSDEQIALQDTLQNFINRQYSFEQRRAILASEQGLSRDIWQQFAEIGLLALPFAEADGGLGGTAVDTMIVMEAVGRGLIVEPYLAAVILAGGLIQNIGNTQQKAELIPAIADGSRILALAHYESRGRYALNYVGTTASTQGDGFVLSGHKSVVLGATMADTLLVSARTGGSAADTSGISLFLIDAKAAGLHMSPYATQDGARAADIRLENVRLSASALVGSIGAALPALERAFDHAGAALVAESVGIMTALNEATLEYLKSRKQFGVPIGKFQALQHRMADMVIAMEQTRSMAILAAAQVNSADEDVRRNAIAGARAYVGEAARRVGQEAVQLHGAMGVVDELIVSHYFKRLTMIEQTFGDSDYHLGRFSDALQVA